MIFSKIKIITFSSLMVVSCANVSFKPSNLDNYIGLAQSSAKTAKNLIFRNNNLVLQDSEYSRIVVSQNNKPQVTMTLRNFEQYDEWLSSDNVLVITHNGKVIASSFLDNDLRIVNPPNLKEILAPELHGGESYHHSFISFSNPKTQLLPLSFKYEFIKKTTLIPFGSKKTINVNLFSEYFHLDTIGWEGKNFYWVDQNGVVLRSKQHITPNNKLRIDYLY